MEQLPKFKTKRQPSAARRATDRPLSARSGALEILILKTYDLARTMRDAGVPVICGFQTPMEKECLRLLLRGSQPVVICPARGIDNMQVPRGWRGPLNEGKLLVLSPFSAIVRRATPESAAQRNELVADLARQVFITHAAPGNKTESSARKLTAHRQVAADAGQPSEC